MTLPPKPSQTIQMRLFLLLLVALLPILLIQAYLYYERLKTTRAEELQANLDLARAVGVAFNGLVQDILHTELAIGIAISCRMRPATWKLQFGMSALTWRSARCPL
jgi:hypothetical protein